MTPGKIPADYKVQPIEEYFNNPLIEALPYPALTVDERSGFFIQRNHISKKEKELPAFLRVGKLSNISKIFVPTNWGLSLSQIIDLLIREGYRKRNPLTNGHIRTAYNIEIGSLYDLPDLKDPIGSTFVIGHSGMGKTTTVQKYLSNYPQVIEHTEYCSIPLNIKQVVYLHVDVPPDGLIRNFCLEFLSEIDSLLETHYYERNKKSSIGVLSKEIAKLCSMHHIGIIIIDECENLLNGNYGKDRLTEFLNILSNKIGCPFCLIGTPESQALLDGTFRLCRRFERKTSKVLKPYSADSKDWKTLVDTLWNDGLYLNQKNELTEEIFTALHECSAGIPAVLKDLLFEVQRVILNNPSPKEKITVDLLKEVSKDCFPNTSEKVAAILTNNLTQLKDMGDGIIPGKAGYRKKSPERKSSKSDNNYNKLVETIFSILVQIGYDEYFTENELKEQARSMAVEIGPAKSKVFLTTEIIKTMSILIKEKGKLETENIPASDLNEDVTDVGRLF